MSATGIHLPVMIEYYDLFLEPPVEKLNLYPPPVPFNDLPKERHMAGWRCVCGEWCNDKVALGTGLTVLELGNEHFSEGWLNR